MTIWSVTGVRSKRLPNPTSVRWRVLQKIAAGLLIAIGSACPAFAGTATHFTVAVPSTAAAGNAFSVTVTALDASNAVATGYTGMAHFTSTDSMATLPADSTLTNGVGTFSVVLKTAGTQTITATDTVSNAVSGTNAIIVNAAPISTTTTLVSSSNPSAAGQSVTFTATVSGTTPMGTVTFKDGAAVLGMGTLVNGVATFTISALTIGSHSITGVYGGDTHFAASTSAALAQTVGPAPDSLKLRALQVLVTPKVAQISGQAISGAADSAIDEAFSGGGGNLVTPSASGVRFNFAANPAAPAGTPAPRASDPFTSATGSFVDGRGFGSHPASPSRVDDTFSALGYAGPVKAAPPFSLQKDWFAWAEVRGAVLEHLNGPLVGPGTSVLSGDQVNVLLGLTRVLVPNFVIGVLGGYETFDYRSDALEGRLKGNGWTVGSYLGWKITQDIRFDTSVAYSGIGFDGSAGTATGSFNGTRWLFASGLTGTYKGYGMLFEPSARVYALWEHENAYTDSLGAPQGARDFSAGRASGGLKVSYPVAWSATTALIPYIGLYGDYYFNNDNAGALFVAGIPAVPLPPAAILQGWSARATGGLAATFDNGSQIAIGAERSGIGGNFALWTYRARVSVPFGPQ